MQKRQSWLTAVVLTLLILFTMPVHGLAGTPFDQDSLRWHLAVDPAPVTSRTNEAAKLQLELEGIQTTVTGDAMEIGGESSPEQMRAALFHGVSSLVDFLGGPVELTLYLPADGTPVTLNLEARSTAGYRWDVVSGGHYTASGESKFERRSPGFGAPAIQTLQLQAIGNGDTTVRLKYHRRFEPDAPTHAKLSIRMPAVGDLDVVDPTPARIISDADISAARSSTEPSPYAELVSKSLPTSWDWRTQGIVPAVRNQGGCGSCWAFGTVGAMESAVKKGGGPLTDLSEQFLISCNRDGWNCADGGLTAHKYHYNTLGKSQTAIGAVLESAKPYTATDGTCATALSHPYKLNSWAFVTGSEWTMPTNDQLKNAIYTYGPITAGVCADDGWYSYTTGVYKPKSNQCRGSTDHQIVLVGWDDATSSWILRNSWGPNWGENGYMRIAYDPGGTTSRVGEGTSWVKYTAPTTVPIPYRPSGDTYTLKPAYSWSRVGTASSYKLQVYDTAAGTYPVNMTVSSSYCSSTTNRCSYTPSTSLTNNKSYQWRVAAGSGAFSSWMNFVAKYGFNSQFNGSSTGWSARRGTWTVNSTVYYTNGVPNKWSTASYNANFGNFTYTARMKRVDNTGLGHPSGLVVRGSSSSFDSTYNWSNAYELLYSQLGKFMVLKRVAGVQTVLKSWTASSAILKNNWNTLKVIAEDSKFRFYINNVLVWSGSDTSFAAGQVGLLMYRDAVPSQLLVDWATLGM